MNNPPTQKLYAGELRRARTNAGMTQASLAEAIQYAGSTVAAIEQCRRVPNPDFTKRCDAVLATDGLLGRIREMLSEETLMPWFRDWVQFEDVAVANLGS